MAGFALYSHTKIQKFRENSESVCLVVNQWRPARAVGLSQGLTHAAPSWCSTQHGCSTELLPLPLLLPAPTPFYKPPSPTPPLPPALAVAPRVISLTASGTGSAAELAPLKGGEAGMLHRGGSGSSPQIRV